MTLDIVWSNPVPLLMRKRRVGTIVVDELGAVYAVQSTERIAVFETPSSGSPDFPESRIGCSSRSAVKCSRQGRCLWKPS